MKEKKLTGYPSVDKPRLQYYSDPGTGENKTERIQNKRRAPEKVRAAVCSAVTGRIRGSGPPRP